MQTPMSAREQSETYREDDFYFLVLAIRCVLNPFPGRDPCFKRLSHLDTVFTVPLPTLNEASTPSKHFEEILPAT
jgi:hypothetical protein